MTTAANPYLQGNFAPVHEEVTATELTGHGPAARGPCGRYLRNGPNPVSAPEPATYHWFTGDGMVHGIRLRDGRAEWYRNRWVRSGRCGPRPRRGAAARAGARRDGLRCRTRTSSATPGARSPSSRRVHDPYELTDELETIGPCDFGGTLERRLHRPPQARPAAPASSTPCRTSSGWGDDVEVTILDAAGAGALRRGASPWAVRSACTTRAITQRYIVLLDLPVTFSMEAARRGRQLPLPLAGGVPRPGRPAAARRRLDRRRLARRRALLRVPPA